MRGGLPVQGGPSTQELVWPFACYLKARSLNDPIDFHLGICASYNVSTALTRLPVVKYIDLSSKGCRSRLLLALRSGFDLDIPRLSFQGLSRNIPPTHWPVDKDPLHLASTSPQSHLFLWIGQPTHNFFHHLFQQFGGRIKPCRLRRH